MCEREKHRDRKIYLLYFLYDADVCKRLSREEGGVVSCTEFYQIIRKKTKNVADIRESKNNAHVLNSYS